MAKVICCLNQKGGSAKTSTAVHLAVALTNMYDRKVALADADPQESAIMWLRRDPESPISLYQVGGEDGKKLKLELAEIDADIVVLDLPPSLEAISLRAALHADLILLPAGPSPVDISATKAAVGIVKEVLDLVPDKKYLLVPSRVQMNTSNGRELRSVLATWGPVSRATICLRNAFALSAATGQGITEFAPESPAANEIRSLASEVAEILGIVQERGNPNEQCP